MWIKLTLFSWTGCTGGQIYALWLYALARSGAVGEEHMLMLSE